MSFFSHLHKKPSLKSLALLATILGFPLAAFQLLGGIKPADEKASDSASSSRSNSGTNNGIVGDIEGSTVIINPPDRTPRLSRATPVMKDASGSLERLACLMAAQNTAFEVLQDKGDQWMKVKILEGGCKGAVGWIIK